MEKRKIHLISLIRKLKNKNVVIWGSGAVAVKLKFILESVFSIPITMFIDTKNSYNRVSSIDFKSPDLIKKFNDNVAILVSNNLKIGFIYKYLIELGYKPDVHIFNGVQLVTSYYGFDVGKYTYGFSQFLKIGINLESIGSFCSIAENVNIAMGRHPTDCVTTHPFFYKKNFGLFLNEDTYVGIDEKQEKIKIGNDVWIGTNVTILPSVTISNGAIIGAGSVVTKDVPDYAIVAGVPARILRFRFNDYEIKKLNKIKWWDWPDEKIKENLPLFKNPKEFLSKF